MVYIPLRPTFSKAATEHRECFGNRRVFTEILTHRHVTEDISIY